MNKSLIKKFHFFLSSIFIFLIHLPFVFANFKPSNDIIPGSKNVNLNDNVSYLHKKYSILLSGENLYDSLKLNTFGLSRQAYDYAIKGFDYLLSKGKLQNPGVISIVDFSLSSGKKRFFVLDLKKSKVLFNTYVAHGKNSGDDYATQFSNNIESLKSSLGFYVTQQSYNGNHGYSLHLEGEEKGFNDNAGFRAIVMHSASYVNETIADTKGCVGRSFGCPAIPEKINKPVIEKIKNGSCLFLYSPDKYYLSHSQILRQVS